MFNRNKIMPKLNYDSDTTGYYSSSSQSESPLSRSQFILRPSSGASSIYHLESPSLQTDYYEPSSCMSVLSNSSTIEESVYKEQSADPNFADADDELTQPIAKLQVPKLKDLPVMQLLSGKSDLKPLRRHSILLRLDTDTLETAKPQYNSLRRIKEKVTNSIRNFKSESQKPRLFEKNEKLYTTRSSSATSNFIPAYSELPKGLIYKNDESAPANFKIGYSNTLPVRTRSSSQMSGSHYCQTIYLPSFAPELLPESLEGPEIVNDLKKLAISSKVSPLEHLDKNLKVGQNSQDSNEDNHKTKTLDSADEYKDFWSDEATVISDDSKKQLEKVDHGYKDKGVKSHSPELRCFKEEDCALSGGSHCCAEPRYENELCTCCTPIQEGSSDTNAEVDDETITIQEENHSTPIAEREVQMVEEYIEPDSPTTISSSYLNDSEENLEQLFDEVELMQQIEKELSLRPSTSTEPQTLRRNKVFIKEPDQDCKIYFEEKLKNFKRIANKVPNPKSILKKNPAPCHIYEEIQNDYLEPYPCDIRPNPPHRPVVVPNNIFQPCTSFSTNMFKCKRYPAILRKKKLPSLHFFSTTRKSSKS